MDTPARTQICCQPHPGGGGSLEVTVPIALAAQAHTIPLAPLRQATTMMSHNCVQVTIQKLDGSNLLQLSGSTPLFDPCGFVVPLTEAGTHAVRLLEQTLPHKMGGRGLWVRFVRREEV